MVEGTEEPTKSDESGVGSGDEEGDAGGWGAKGSVAEGNEGGDERVEERAVEDMEEEVEGEERAVHGRIVVRDEGWNGGVWRLWLDEG